MREDLLSRDPERVIGAMWAVIRLRDGDQLDTLAASLPEIERATAGLALGGLFYSNDDTLAFALRKLRHHRDGVGCLCRLYPGLLLFDPEKEADAGNVRILETGHETIRCACSVCGARYEVRHGEAHWSWWEWTAAGPSPG